MFVTGKEADLTIVTVYVENLIISYNKDPRSNKEIKETL